MTYVCGWCGVSDEQVMPNRLCADGDACSARRGIAQPECTLCGVASINIIPTGDGRVVCANVSECGGRVLNAEQAPSSNGRNWGIFRYA